MTNLICKIKGLTILAFVAGSLVAAVPANAWEGEHHGGDWGRGGHWGGHGGGWGHGWGHHGWWGGPGFGYGEGDCWRWTPYGWVRVCY